LALHALHASPVAARDRRMVAAVLLTVITAVSLLGLAEMVPEAIFEVEFNASASFPAALRWTQHGTDFAALAAEFHSAGLRVLSGLTDVCHGDAKAAVAAAAALQATMSTINVGLQRRARGVAERLHRAQAPASSVALVAAVESRSVLETSATPECRMLVDRLNLSSSCRDLIDVGMMCAQSFALFAQQSVEALKWIHALDNGKAAAIATWTFNRDKGKTRAETLGLLLELMGAVGNNSTPGEAGFESSASEGRFVLMAEVGVWTSELSAALLESFPALQMLLVDPYHLRVGGSLGGASGDQGFSVAALEKSLEVTQPHRARATHIVQSSIEAASWVAPRSLDLAFIDGDHSHEGARSDIHAWWPLLKNGGLLAGHDYTFTWPGVVRAVNEFALTKGLAVHFTPEVWWLEQPGAS